MKVEIGAIIKIIEMKDEPNYKDKLGVVTYIDSAGQIHGTWGGCALLNDDRFIILNNEKKLKKWRIYNVKSKTICFAFFY